MRKIIVFMGMILFFGVSFCLAQEEITITTYYPSPYGVYEDLKANSLAVGSAYQSESPPDGNLIVSGNVGIRTTDPQATLDINGDLMLSGKLYLPAGENLIVNNGALIVHPVDYPEPWGSVYVSMGQGAGGTYYDGVYATPNLHLESAGRIVFLTSGNNDRGSISEDGNWEIVGNLTVHGNLSKGSGGFVIDHPLDPENQVLQHSFVESNQMMNIYKGRGKLENGVAEINLPDYFAALNHVADTEVFLSCINGWSPLYFIENFDENKFVVKTTAGGNPKQEFSWVVYTVRNDPFARSHPLVVEQIKGEGNLYKKGEYIHPGLYPELSNTISPH
ncbi:MAG: hypothetical protein DRH17_13480 [Deltaproteobacteria bacterium]|nr:MAG: hypothetical protein DRH17_13480 [Deltaproteobacteria bacterium]